MSNHRHFMLHKPVGYVCQFIREQKRTKKLLGELFDFPKGTMAVGRLDEKSEGLLLLTTDGKESNRICSSGIEKEYHVQVDGEITDEAVQFLQEGVEIGINGKKYLTKPCAARKLEQAPDYGSEGWKIRDDRHGPTSWVSITITEGKFRQVRKMTAAVGFPTLRLVRARIGGLYLGKLKSGEVVEVEKFI